MDQNTNSPYSRLPVTTDASADDPSLHQQLGETQDVLLPAGAARTNNFSGYQTNSGTVTNMDESLPIGSSVQGPMPLSDTTPTNTSHHTTAAAATTAAVTSGNSMQSYDAYLSRPNVVKDLPVQGPAAVVVVNEEHEAGVDTTPSNPSVVNNLPIQGPAKVVGNGYIAMDANLNTEGDKHGKYSEGSYRGIHANGYDGSIEVTSNEYSTTRDLGWHRPVVEMPDPLIEGVSNGKLFSMIRRFNNDVFDVRAIDTDDGGRQEATLGPDLNDAWSDEYVTDRMAVNLQRVYLSIVLDMASFLKQLARLRSWKETNRTAGFCLAYFIAWTFDLLIPLTLSMIMVLVSSPEARHILFPPVPLSLVNMATGGVQKPQAGQLGTGNTLTGAPEKREYEAVEEEASNFAKNMRHLVGRAIGMHQKQANQGGSFEDKIPGPIKNAAKAVKEAGSGPGHASNDDDQTEQPMEEILWDFVNPENIETVMKAFPHAVGEVVDVWERVSNVISPMPPMKDNTYIRLEMALAPVLLTSIFINYYMVYKIVGLSIGMFLFAKPITSSGLEVLNRQFPTWTDQLQPKNNLLRGIPTNTQLTLMLLRTGEAHNTPIPPPSLVETKDPDLTENVNKENIPLGATSEELDMAIYPSSMDKSYAQEPDKDEDEEGEDDDSPKHPKLAKFISSLKSNVKGAIHIKSGIDHVRAKTGSESAREHVGVLVPKDKFQYAGPSEFNARYQGKSGWIYIINTPWTKSDPNTISGRNEIFNKTNLNQDKIIFNTQVQGNIADPILEVRLGDIVRLKRTKASPGMLVGMATEMSSDKQVLDSLEIEVKGREEPIKFTAVLERDELFNRLVAVGGQRWENV